MQAKLLKHIKFLLSSTNQHGVHSPFVFEYLTKCLYKKKVYSKSKAIDILLKSISYFEYNNVRVAGNENLRELVGRKFDTIALDQHPNDLIFFEEINPDLVSRIFFEEETHNESMVLINNIHKNKITTDLWSSIIKNEKATVTIDFFYCGAVFFRQEQVKEHFKIRI